jgi:hypothetical protein
MCLGFNAVAPVAAEHFDQSLGSNSGQLAQLLHFSLALRTLADIADLLDHSAMMCVKPAGMMKIGTVRLPRKKGDLTSGAESAVQPGQRICRSHRIGLTAIHAAQLASAAVPFCSLSKSCSASASRQDSKVGTLAARKNAIRQLAKSGHQICGVHPAQTFVATLWRNRLWRLDGRLLSSVHRNFPLDQGGSAKLSVTDGSRWPGGDTEPYSCYVGYTT